MRDITLGETIDFKFTTTEPDTGAPATLAGTPVISAYVGNSVTQITAGITLTVDFDGVTGLHNVRVVATSGNGYSDNSDVALVITTGTVDAVSAVGYKVAEFTIGRAAAYTRLGAPAGASVSADIAAIEAQTDDIGAAGAGLTAVPWNAAWDAEVQSEVQDAIEANNLDHIVGTATGIPAVVAGTYIDQIMDDGTAVYDRTTDSLQALRDNTGTAGAGLTVLATQTSVNTIDDFLDTEIAAILAAVDTEVAAIITTLGTPAGASVSADIAAIEAQTDDIGAAGAGLTAVPWNAAWDAEVQSEVADALAVYDPPTNAEMEARTIAAANYATAANLAVVDGIADNLVSGIIFGAAATGTLSTTQASTNLTGYANDQLIGRVVIWLTGACEGEASDITDYVETNGVLTFTALTTAPGNGDTFKIV